MKVFKVILEDNHAAYREIIPAENTTRLKEQWSGNGEIVSIKDVTDEHKSDFGMLNVAGIEQLSRVLTEAHYGQDEIDIICRTLREVYKF